MTMNVLGMKQSIFVGRRDCLAQRSAAGVRLERGGRLMVEAGRIVRQ